ncbi:MAG: hypothetical protein CMH41_01700 [Micrococcales bacterium]|nr:hypothetical protein [Micrococcales bacterium]
MLKISKRLISAIAAVFMMGGLLMAAGPAQAGKNKFFETQNGKVSCEMIKSKSITEVLCESLGNKIKSATLKKNGDVTKCKGLKCASNPPEDVSVLKKGKKKVVGPFKCRAKSKKAVICKVTKSGAGFKMNSKPKIKTIAGANP